MEELKKIVDKELECIVEVGIDAGNLDTLYKLIDIRKDISKIETLEKEDMSMSYGNYGRRRRDSRGRYTEGRGGYNERGNYRNNGRGGEGGNYGHYPDEMFDRMMEGYDGYMEGMEGYRRGGNYNAKDEGMESLEYMLKSMVEFFEYLQNDSDSQEEVELIKQYARKIKEM